MTRWGPSCRHEPIRGVYFTIRQLRAGIQSTSYLPSTLDGTSMMSWPLTPLRCMAMSADSRLNRLEAPIWWSAGPTVVPTIGLIMSTSSGNRFPFSSCCCSGMFLDPIYDGRIPHGRAVGVTVDPRLGRRHTGLVGAHERP